MNDTATPKPQTLDDTVTFAISMDTVVGHGTSYDSEGEPVYDGPITLADRVAEIVASRLVQQAGRDYLPNVRHEAAAVAERLVEQKFRDVLDREFVPTDSYGASKGEPTTIGELIVQRADAWLKAPNKTDSYGRATKTNLQALIDDAVGRAFTTEVQEAIKSAQAAAVAEVSKQAADVFAEIIRRAAS